MRKTLFAWLLVLFVVAPVSAQTIDTGSITAGGADCSTAARCAIFENLPPQWMNVTLQVSGTFSATLQFEATADGTNWVSVMAVNVADGSSASSSTATGVFSLSNAGYSKVRVRCSAYTSGTAVVTAVRGWSLARWLTPYFRSLTVAQGSLTTDLKAISTTATWNEGSTTFTHWLANVTDTASASGSKLWDAQVGGVSMGSLRKDGQLTVANNILSGAGYFIGGNGRSGFLSQSTTAFRVVNSSQTNTYDITLADWGTTLSPEGQSVANNGTLLVGTTTLGYVFLTITGDDRACAFIARGSTNTVVDLTGMDPDDNCTAVKNTATRINFYYDAAGASGAGYYLQNMRGSTVTVRVLVPGGS